MATLSKKYESFAKKMESKHYEELAEKCRESFVKQFYNEKRKCLYDVIGDAKIRPNQLFALSLKYQVIDPTSEIAKNIINVVEKKLLNSYGLKTLAKGEKNYVDIYEGDGFRRDMSYHQGITWPWLLGLYYNALRNMGEEQKVNDFKEKVEKTFKKELYTRGCIGSISELYDSKAPNLPKGTFAQAWSVAEIFRMLY